MENNSPEKAVVQTDDAGCKLYRRFLEGDEGSFAGLVTMYKDALIGFIAAITGDKNDAEDVAIDAFAVLAVNRKKCHENVSFKTFLFAIGKNLAFKYARKHRKRPDLLGESCDDLWVKAGAFSPEDDFLRSQDRERLSFCVGRLKNVYRSVLYLLFYEDLSYAEAAKVMGKTEGQIRGLASRAKKI